MINNARSINNEMLIESYKEYTDEKNDEEATFFFDYNEKSR